MTNCPYQCYKESGQPWLGALPSNWQLRRIKTLFFEKDERCGNRNGLLLSLTRTRGLIPQNQASNRIALAEDLSKYKVCRPGDLVMNRMQAWSGMFGLSSIEGLVSPDYSVFRKIFDLNVKYFEYLFKTHIFVGQFAQLSKGIGTGFNRLYTPEFGSIACIFPPLEEQNAIVRYLDYMDRRIKRYIRAKQKLIKLLEEQKQAIIHQAVTRGLDPNAKMKPSGIEWLGDIPEHWEILPGKVCFQEKRKTLNTRLINNKVLSLSYGKIIVKPKEKMHGLVPASFETYQVIEKNDIIVRPTDLQNDHTSLRFGLCNEKGIITSAYLCLNPKDKLISKYGYLLLHNYDLIKIIYGLGSGLRQNLSWDDFKYLPCLVPPIFEQILITDYIQQSDTSINTMIEKLRYESEILQEYRSRLIADIVTGKLDIRQAAAQLPDELEEPELLEDDLPEDAEEILDGLDEDREEGKT